ncbi:hypothetical protein HY768_08380 [candidate division TA06 bacterium]|uniref:PorV/PorQ family protein n=1 Tax=candidate division TA06 bacterium TaxID=2250710 RepID=A0A933MK14_UNCT6|nr:hypothetical protein [candidate division TA06 bacterium]
MKKILFIMLGLAIAASVRAESYGGEFLNLGVGARAQGMGGAYGPLANDASAIYWNPAGLSGIIRPEIMFCHTQLFGGLANHDFLGLAWPLNKRLSLGLGWIRLGVDDIPRFSYNVGTMPEGSFGDNENAVYVSAAFQREVAPWGKPLKLSAGGSVKLIYNKLDDRQASGLGLDFGLQAKLWLAEWLAVRSANQVIVGMEPAVVERSNWGTIGISLAAQDIGGTSISWNTSSQHNDIKPAGYKAGISYAQPIFPWRSQIILSAEVASQSYQKGRLGLEVDYRNLLTARLGRDQKDLVWGGGVTVWRLKFDWAYAPHQLGSTHRVGCSFKL